MPSNTPEPLTTEANRQRRLGDAGKLVPVLGCVLLLMPVLWPVGSTTSSAMVYIFSVWAFLIVLIGVISRLLWRHVRRDDTLHSSRDS